MKVKNIVLVSGKVPNLGGGKKWPEGELLASGALVIRKDDGCIAVAPNQWLSCTICDEENSCHKSPDAENAVAESAAKEKGEGSDKPKPTPVSRPKRGRPRSK